jgi:hypothetical protein
LVCCHDSFDFSFGSVVWIFTETRLGMILESPDQKTRGFLV